jgi:acyl-coenzyme A thioesterase PaaI-like protein
MHSQFVGAGEIDEPLDAVTEVIKETRRYAFLRGTVVQGQNVVAAFSGTMRKA